MIKHLINPRFLRLVFFSGVLGAVLLPASLRAQSTCMLAPVGLAQRVQQAPLVVEARIVSQRTERLAQGPHLVTRTYLQVFKVFKGKLTVGLMSVLTPGGTLNLVREDVTGTALLPVGEQGLFLLEADPTQPGEWRTAAGPQGFIQYNLADLTATETFGHYASISDNLYQAVAAQTGGAYQELLPNASLARATRLASQPRATQASTLAPSISSFSPSSVVAGLGEAAPAVLTITGAGFGEAQGAGYVQFRNADSPGPEASPTYTKPMVSDYLSWTDTQIRVRVPSYSKTGNAAGTGLFQVATDAGALATSSSLLTVTYALSNVADPDAGQTYRAHLISANDNGGYTLQYGPSFPVAARAPFERALFSWQCATGINRTIDAAATTTDAVANDNVNVVRFDKGDELPAGVLATTHSYYIGCSGGVDAPVSWVLAGTDYTFDSGTNWNYTTSAPTSAQYDFQSVALHEQGHGAQLTHIISDTGVMSYALANGQTKRTLEANTDMAAGRDIMSFSTNATEDDLCGVDQMTPSTAACPLPVVLTAFAARYQASQGTQLNWATASELHSEAFVVESQSTAAGDAWQAVGRLAAAGSSVTPRQYHFLDARPLAGTRYYRLRQLDQDGTVAYSPVVAVSANVAAELAAYPNPARALAHLSGPLAAGATAQVRLLDAAGRCLASLAGPAGQATFDLPLAGVPAGFYLVEWEGGVGTSRVRLVVE
jgi:hypothetical protein